MSGVLRRFFQLNIFAVLVAMAATASAQGLVNINTAGQSELETLTGIGPTKARNIIDHREQNGPFASIERITDVSGIGQGTLNNIRDSITVGDGSVAAATTPTEVPDSEPDELERQQDGIDLSDDDSSLGGPSGPPAHDDYDPPLDDGTPAVASASGLININSASQSELQTLPGIGPSKASAIIDYREQNGNFTAVDQLDDVSGIGPATLAAIRDLVTVE